MELISQPKTECLYEASLDSLHAMSVKWTNELKFWSDQMSFFFAILHKKDGNKPFPSADLALLEKEMMQIIGDQIDKTKSDVKRHEQRLKDVLSMISSGDERNYRETHGVLLIQLHNLFLLMRDFKKRVFEFVRTSNGAI